MDDAKSAGSSYIDTLTGIEDTIGKTTEAVKELGEEIIKEGKIASDIADQRAKADKLERQLIVDRAESDRQRAELLEQAVDREQFTVEQRIGFLEEAGKLEEDITNKEIQAAKIRLEAKQAENALAGTTKEDLEEEARLKAQVIQLETARLTKQKEVTSQTIALKAEEAAELKAIEDQKIADKAEKDANDIEAAKILADLKIQIREAEAVSEEERRALEIEKVTEHYDKLIALAKAQGLSIVNLEKGKATALDNINKTESDNEINWAELTQKQKVDIIAKGFSDLSTILGEESAAGKAAAIASTTISTLQSAQDSYKSLSGIPIIGPALGAAAYGAALVQGFRTIKQIKATKNPVSTASEQSVSTPSITAPTTTTPQTPSFDILGTSGVNQIASALGQQAPVQAFVVSQDVTTAQSLQNNIVQGASLG
jgi:hypothetical protein